ncbi:MAG: hypothetical protein BroJett007_02910 [Chloroflexota bacterium]|nr:MAG: hypothetical protein BroJett007_02910 [Chloroflexota bacterium]
MGQRINEPRLVAAIPARICARSASPSALQNGGITGAQAPRQHYAYTALTVTTSEDRSGCARKNASTAA